MSLAFEEEYAVEWCVDESRDWWEVSDECNKLSEAKDTLAWKREHYPDTKYRIAVRYVSEWKPLGGEA